MSRQPERELLEFLHTSLEQFSVVRFCGWDHAESNVWEVSADGKRFYLKAYRQPRKFQQERYAYRHWTPHLSPLTPRLIAAHERPNALLLSAVPGALAQVALNETQEREVYRQAGAFLRRLHDVPCEDTDSLPLADALLMRSASWAKRAEGLVEERTVGWVRSQLEDAAITIKRRGWTRVPCHRDYTPRNWLLDGQGLYVIDFEHARPDLWLTDLEKLRSSVWLERPDLEAAFFRGYGRSLTGEERDVLEKLALHGALVSVAWAWEHGDRVFERQGRAVLKRLEEGLKST